MCICVFIVLETEREERERKEVERQNIEGQDKIE